MLRLVLTMIALATIATPSLSADEPLTTFAKMTYTSDGKTLNYRLLSPKTIESDKKYPLVLFLHGAGERGDDNERQLVHGMKDFLKPENREKYPCFVVAPQCPNGQKWVEVDWGADTHKSPEEISEPLGLTFAVLDTMLKERPVDSSRVYITGLSMGGYGTWDAIQRRPKFFAAALPICGGGDETGAAVMKEIPIWVFHGDKDTAVKPFRSVNMVNAIKKAGGNPKFTMYSGVGHDSWTQTYANPEVFAWLFAQRKPE